MESVSFQEIDGKKERAPGHRREIFRRRCQLAGCAGGFMNAIMKSGNALPLPPELVELLSTPELREASLDPEGVLAAFRALADADGSVLLSMLQKEHPDLMYEARRHYGTFLAALAAAGVRLDYRRSGTGPFDDALPADDP
jgi:hypothetical protein